MWFFDSFLTGAVNSQPFFFSARDGCQHCTYDKEVFLGTRLCKDTSSVCCLLRLPQQSGQSPFPHLYPLTEVRVCVCVLFCHFIKRKRSLMAGIVFNHSPYLPQCPAFSRCSIHTPKDELRRDASGSEIWKSVPQKCLFVKCTNFFHFFHISGDLGAKPHYKWWLPEPLYFHCFDLPCVGALKLLFASLYNLHLGEAGW